MRIVIIGTGRVAYSLGLLISKSHHTIEQVYGRNEQKAKQLAEKLNASFTTSLQSLADADLYIIAISDTALMHIGEQFELAGKWVVHTAGAVSKKILNGITRKYGVLYPLQSLNGLEPVRGSIPFLIDAVDRDGLQMLEALCASAGSDFRICNDIQRKQMHLAAVWVNNFPNFLYSIAYNICREQELDFSLLNPIIRETANRLQREDPWIFQTGPAKRKDDLTIQSHLQLMQEHPDWQHLYKEITFAIKKRSTEITG